MAQHRQPLLNDVADAPAPRQSCCSNHRVAILNFFVGRGYLWTKIFVFIDNFMILLLNTSIGFLEVSREIVLINAVIGIVYVIEIIALFIALRSHFFGSMAHMCDSVVVLAKALTLIHLFLFFDKQAAQQLDYPLLIVYTGLRTFCRSSCQAYHRKLLRLFESDNLHLASVLSRLKNLEVSTEEQSQLQQLLKKCVKSEEIHPSELFKFLQKVGEQLPNIARQVTTVLCSTIAVEVLECKDITTRRALFCEGSLQNASGPVLSLVDRAQMRVTSQRTHAAETTGRLPAWNEVLYFEGVPRDTDSIQIDIAKGDFSNKCYQVHVPIQDLRADVPLDRWFNLHSKKDSKDNTASIHLRIGYVLSTFSSDEGEPRFLKLTGPTDNSPGLSTGVLRAPSYGVGEVIISTFKHWLPFWKTQIFGVFVLSANAATVPATAYFQKMLTDDVLGVAQRFNPESRTLLIVCMVAIVLLYFASMLTGFLIGWVQARVNSQATARLRLGVLTVVLTSNNPPNEDVNSVFSSDIARVSSLWGSFFWNLLGPLFSIVYAMGYLFVVNPNAGIMGFGFLAIVFSGGPKRTAANKSRELSDATAEIISEYSSAVDCEKVIRTYRIQSTVLGRFQTSLTALQSLDFGTMFWTSNMQQYIETCLNFFTTIQTVALGLQCYMNFISLGEFFSMVMLYTSIVRPASSLGGFSRVALVNAGSLQKLDDLLKQSSTELSKPRVKPADVGSIAMQNVQVAPASYRSPVTSLSKNIIELSQVNYGHDGKQILKGFTASIPRGKYTCLVGSSGSGKTSILNLLLGFYRQTDGDIFVNGKNIRDEDAESHKLFGVVFQEAMLLHGTVRENIAFGNPQATHADVEWAVKTAQLEGSLNLDKFVRSKQKGMSGGEAQRICLARALVRKAPILLLDEATSALDPKATAAITQTFKSLTELKDQDPITVVSVTHNMRSCTDADLILVLQNGIVAEKGTYSELVQKAGLFADMLCEEEKSPPSSLLSSTSTSPVPTSSKKAS